MADILPPNAIIGVLNLQMNEETIQQFKATEKQQEMVSKLKQVTEDQLRMRVEH
jgi:hypothetical protein